jgi:pimeloyl-ACP methyl ester carboxylesterase
MRWRRERANDCPGWCSSTGGYPLQTTPTSQFVRKLPRGEALLRWTVGIGVSPKTPEHIAARLGAQELVTLEGAGHCPQLEQPDAFAAALEKFVNVSWAR